MTLSITACPKCKTLLLDDTEMCPSCHHVLKEGSAHLAELYTAGDTKYDGSKDIACRDCEALNRDGLVRCWQCGAFLREEIEQAYQEMKAHPAQAVPVQPIPDLSNLEKETQSENSDFGDDFELADDDFELADDVSMVQAELVPEPEAVENPIPEIKFDQTEEHDEQEENEEEEKDLFDLAVSEEKEAAGPKKRTPGKMSFLVKCPSCSSNIRVQSYRQGKIGQCPKCSLPFMVPVLVPPKKAEDKKGKKEKGKVESLPEDQIITSVDWHEINEKKFKPKAKSLAGKGTKVDIIRCKEGLLFAWAEKKGLMGVAAAQTEKARSDIAHHLLAGKPASNIPATRSELIPVELLQQVRFIWPGTVENEIGTDQESEDKDEQATVENFTAGIPVFGDTAIVLEIPLLPIPVESETKGEAEAPVHPGLKQDKKKKKPKKPKKKKVKPPADPLTRCLSLTLSQYRKVRVWLEELTGQPNFLFHAQIPLENVTEQWKCELSEKQFDALASPEYYLSDPAIDTTIVGWLCQCNEVAVSEQARAEQKYGGKKPAGLAKVKCPKCEQKFGQNPLHHLTSIVAPPPVEEEKESPKKKSDADEKTSDQAKAPQESQKASTTSTETSESTDAKKKTKRKFSLKSLFGKKKKKVAPKQDA